MLYSNFGFDLLAMALSAAAKKPYPELLKEHITGPVEMKDTGFTLTDEQKKRSMQGQAPDGYADAGVPTGPSLSALAASIRRRTTCSMDEMASRPVRAERRRMRACSTMRSISMRDGLKTVSGMDESGHMDGLGLAWVGMMAKDDSPFILQKAGGLQGTFCYIAFAPTRNVGVFIAINKFDLSAAFAMGEFANELLATLAPR